MADLRLAFPNDRQKDYFTDFLVRSDLIRARASMITSTGVVELDRVVGVSSNDLPVLLLDGVFDAVLTTSDRLAECEAAERTRPVPRPFGKVIPLPVAAETTWDSLVWGFPAELVEGGDDLDAETALYELARGGLEFTPGRTMPRTVLCATTHPALAAEAFRHLEITADVRYYPDPWSVVAGSATYCGLGLAGPNERLNRAVAFDTQRPLAEETPLLVFNQVAWASAAKRPQLARLEAALNRFVSAESMVRVEFFGNAGIASAVSTAGGIRHTRVFGQPQQNGEVLIELVVDRAAVHNVLDELEQLGAHEIVVRHLHRADVRE